MKIEKVNDHQIRCTLTKDDLAKRELKISELAYGSDKAKLLFEDMMEQASFELGFEADDIPLMIEAIPMNSECIVLIITKVENPDELDTRFSKFMPQIQGSTDNLEEVLSDIVEHDNEVLDLFKKIQEMQSVKPIVDGTEKPLKRAQLKKLLKEPIMVSVMYSFETLGEIIKLSRMSSNLFDGANSLYKNEKFNNYILVITNSEDNKSSFNKICNMLSEYGVLLTSKHLTEEFISEQYKLLIKGNALQTLAKL